MQKKRREKGCEIYPIQLVFIPLTKRQAKKTTKKTRLRDISNPIQLTISGQSPSPSHGAWWPTRSYGDPRERCRGNCGPSQHASSCRWCTSCRTCPWSAGTTPSWTWGIWNLWLRLLKYIHSVSLDNIQHNICEFPKSTKSMNICHKIWVFVYYISRNDKNIIRDKLIFVHMDTPFHKYSSIHTLKYVFMPKSQLLGLFLG